LRAEWLPWKILLLSRCGTIDGNGKVTLSLPFMTCGRVAATDNLGSLLLTLCIGLTTKIMRFG
jgi:hypothetical protein